MISFPNVRQFVTPVLDTSALINLLGCRDIENVFSSLGTHCVVEEKVRAELLYHPHPGKDCKQVLTDLEFKGYLRSHRMTAEEYDCYLTLVGQSCSDSLGSGESAAIAVAVGINRPVILDDKKARRICVARYAQLDVASTLLLFFAAANNANWNKSYLRQLVEEAISVSGMAILKSEHGLYSQISIDSELSPSRAG